MKWPWSSLDKKGKKTKGQKQVIEEAIRGRLENLEDLSELYREAAEIAMCGMETIIYWAMKSDEIKDNFINSEKFFFLYFCLILFC